MRLREKLQQEHVRQCPVKKSNPQSRPVHGSLQWPLGKTPDDPGIFVFLKPTSSSSFTRCLWPSARPSPCSDSQDLGTHSWGKKRRWTANYVSTFWERRPKIYTDEVWGRWINHLNGSIPWKLQAQGGGFVCCVEFLSRVNYVLDSNTDELQ